jgi:predicted homoserine dehydrogenase-like protein
MVLVDTALAKREADGNPVRVGISGAGYMGRVIALTILTSGVGMRVVAIATRNRSQAIRAFRDAGVTDVTAAESLSRLEEAVAAGRATVTEDATLLCQAGGIDVVVEVTGQVEFGARVALEAIAHGKHVVLVNAELDATLGPALKARADRAGVVITNTDGDEPGVAMNLVRFLRTIGLRPVAAGNIKGMIDHYRTPETQRAFAEQHGQKASNVTSFADGTKLSMETTCLANAAGFHVGRPGMYGPRCAHVREILDLLPRQDMLAGGIVDYVVGAEPHTGAWVVGYEEHPVKMAYLSYFKMGPGPFYLFYTPYHLPHLQIITTIARAAIFGDATVTPVGAPRCEVLTLAKRDLRAGEVLDGLGGFMAYGMIDNAEARRRGNLLPMGVSAGCTLTRDIRRDSAVSYADVRLPPDRLCDRLREEQEKLFAGG